MKEISGTELFEYYKSYRNKRKVEDESVPSCSFRQYLQASMYITNTVKGIQNLKEMDRFIPKHCKVQLIFGETDIMSVSRFTGASIQKASEIMSSPFVYFTHQQGYRMSDVLLSRVHKGKVINNSLMYVTAELKGNSVTDVLERIAVGNGFIKTAENTAVHFRDLRTRSENIIVAEKPFIFPCSMIKEIQITDRGNGTVAEVTEEEPDVLLESTRNFLKILRATKGSG